MKYIITIVFFLVTYPISSQNFSGSVTYKSISKKIKSDSTSSNDEILSFVKKALKSTQDKRYVLDFNKSESVYKQEEELAKPNAGFLSSMSLDDSNETIYKNIKRHQYKIEKELLGKFFLIQDSLINNNWILKSETKKIGEFECRKAIKMDSLVFSNNETKKFEIVAWYCPTIPISNGPELFWGLPGIILEIEKPNYILVSTKVSLDLKKETLITEPVKGEVVSKNEFEIIAKAKLKE